MFGGKFNQKSVYKILVQKAQPTVTKLNGNYFELPIRNNCINSNILN